MLQTVIKRRLLRLRGCCAPGFPVLHRKAPVSGAPSFPVIGKESLCLCLIPDIAELTRKRQRILC